MKRINHIDKKLSDPIEFTRMLSSAKITLEEAFPNPAMCISGLICLLAFKYWHENISCGCNSAIEESDGDYGKDNWVLFGRNLTDFLRKAEMRGELIPTWSQKIWSNDKTWSCFAKALAILSSWITYSRSIEENVTMIQNFFGHTGMDELQKLQYYYRYGRRFSRRTKEKASSMIRDREECQRLP